MEISERYNEETLTNWYKAWNRKINGKEYDFIVELDPDRDTNSIQVWDESTGERVHNFKPSRS